MTPLEDMQIVAARELQKGDIILDGMHKPFTERPVMGVRTPLTEPMQREVSIGISTDLPPRMVRTYSIDDYVSIVPRNQLAFHAPTEAVTNA